MGACCLPPTQARAFRFAQTSPRLLLIDTDASSNGVQLQFKARACLAPKGKMQGHAIIPCVNRRRIKCLRRDESGEMNAVRLHEIKRNVVNLLPHSLLPTRTSPFVCSAAASRYIMDMAIPFNKEFAPLCSKHSVALWLPNARNVTRQTPQRCQMQLLLAVPQSMPSMTISIPSP